MKLAIIKTVATNSKGVVELVNTIFLFCKSLKKTGKFDNKKKTWIRKEITGLVEREILVNFWEDGNKKTILMKTAFPVKLLGIKGTADIGPTRYARKAQGKRPTP